jgi:uncharacterized membrane protein YqiK
MNKLLILRIAVIIIGSIILIFSTMKQNQSSKVLEPKTNFEVVDNYKGRCDVVRYAAPSQATYKYFLDCEK